MVQAEEDSPAVAAREIQVDEFAPLVEQTREKAKAPSVSAAVVLGDRIVWSGAAGVADVEHDVPATAESVYRIGSISKPIAAVAVLQQVEQGKVALDDPIQKYVPSFPEKEQGAVTVRHLLTHAAGVRHYKPGEFESARRFDRLEDAIRIFQDDPLLFQPGEKFSYSSYGYNLLAGVVETAAGQPFDVYLREHVFQPAGMKSACCERAEEIVPHRARSYIRDEVTGALRNAQYVDLSIKWAGGGIIASAEDLARFAIALDEGKLLQPDTMEAMYTPATLADGSASEYALGWRVTTDDTGRRWVAHSGGSMGAASRLLRCPEEKLAVVVLVNLRPTQVPGTLAARLAKLALGADVSESAVGE